MTNIKLSNRTNKNISSKNLISFRRLDNLTRKVFYSFKIILLIMMIFLTFYYAKQLSHYYNASLEYIFNKSNFILKKIYIKNNHFLSKDEIIKSIHIDLNQPIFFINLKSIKAKLEQINWIKSAIITRKLPDILIIEIIERVPIAFWQNEQKLYLLDEEGFIINENNLKPFKDLIILIGEDAALNANSLISILKKNQELYSKISSATRIGERRWNIKFYGGLEIKLPEKNPHDAWDYVIYLYKNQNLFAQDITNIDLRINNRLYAK